MNVFQKPEVAKFWTVLDEMTSGNRAYRFFGHITVNMKLYKYNCKL